MVFAVFAALGPLLMVVLYGIGGWLAAGDVGRGVLLLVVGWIIELAVSPPSAVIAVILTVVAWRASARRQAKVALIILGVALVLLIVQLVLYAGFLG